MINISSDYDKQRGYKFQNRSFHAEVWVLYCLALTALYLAFLDSIKSGVGWRIISHMEERIFQGDKCWCIIQWKMHNIIMENNIANLTNMEKDLFRSQSWVSLYSKIHPLLSAKCVMQGSVEHNAGAFLCHPLVLWFAFIEPEYNGYKMIVNYSFNCIFSEHYIWSKWNSTSLLAFCPHLNCTTHKTWARCLLNRRKIIFLS